MKLDDLIAVLRVLRKGHGNLDVYTKDLLSGVGGAVIRQPGARVATLAQARGRERKRRLYDHVRCDEAPREPGESVVLL